MIGGSRDTNMNICPTNARCPTYNPYNQPSSYGIPSGDGDQTCGHGTDGWSGAGPRIDMAYGFQDRCMRTSVLTTRSG